MALIGYVDTADFTAYATARGITLSLSESVTLTLALDYIEAQTYKGDKTDSEQALEFPRDGDTEVPQGIKNAQMEAALIYDKGGDPIGDVGQRVTQETVVGAVSVSYSDTGNQSTIYRKLNATLAPFLASGGYGSSNFAVSHG
jgi:hypothetical protein